MTPDLLGPMSLSTAQLIENAFEEEQYSYAVDSMTAAAKLGVHPTRDLFLALLAIVYSQMDYHSTEADRRRRKRRNAYAEFDSIRRTRKLDMSDPREIEIYTVCAAMMLLGTLVRDAPNALRTFFPPCMESNQEGVAKAFEGVHEREWLRNADARDHSTGDARSRSTSISTTPIMQIALRMRECKNAWQLLALDVDQKQGGEEDNAVLPRKNIFASPRKTTARRQALDALRDGDGNLEEHERRNMSLYDRPGTWMVLGFLNDLWKRENDVLEGLAALTPRWWCTHLARQFNRLNPRQPKQSAATEMDEAFDLIRAGFTIEEEGHSSKFAKRSTHAFGLLKLLSQLVAHGVLNEGVFVRHCSDRILAADAQVLSYPNDHGADVVLVKSVARFLEHSTTRAEEWKDDVAEAYHACMAMSDMPATTRSLLGAIGGDASWTAHRDDYGQEELKEQTRLIKESDGVIKARYVESALSDPTWQLFEAQGRGAKRKRDGDDPDDKVMERTINAQYTAACVRLRAIDCIHARMCAQSYIHATIMQATRDSAQNPLAHQQLSTIASSVSDRLQDAFKHDAEAIEACYSGILETCGRAQKARQTEWQDVLNEWAIVLQKIQRRLSEAQVARDILEASRE